MHFIFISFTVIMRTFLIPFRAWSLELYSHFSESLRGIILFIFFVFRVSCFLPQHQCRKTMLPSFIYRMLKLQTSLIIFYWNFVLVLPLMFCPCLMLISCSYIVTWCLSSFWLIISGEDSYIISLNWFLNWSMSRTSSRVEYLFWILRLNSV